MGGVLFFRRKFFFSQRREVLWGNLKCFRNFGLSESFMHKRGYHYFPSEVFSLILPTNFVGDTSTCDRFAGFERKFSMRGITRFSFRGCSTAYCRLFFSEYRNFRRGTFSVSLVSVIGKICTQKVYITYFCRSLLSHSTEELRGGTFFVSENIWYGKKYE